MRRRPTGLEPVRAGTSCMTHDAAMTHDVAQYLDADELLYFEMNKVEGMTRSRIAEALGWSRVKTENVVRKLNRHLVELRGPAPRQVMREIPPGDYVRSSKGFRIPTSRFSYLEQLESGKRLWALTPSNRAQCPVLPISVGPIFKGAPIVTMDELKRSFQKEQSTHGRTTEHLHKCRVQSQNDDRALDRGQADLKSDAVAAVLEDRASPNPELEKKLVVLQKAALRSREALETAIEAEQIQRKKVDALAAEISARAREAFLIATLPSREMVRRKILETAHALKTYWETASEHAEHGNEWIEALFPRDNMDPWSSSSELRGSLIGAACALGRIVRDLNSLAQAKEAWKKSA